MKCIIKVDELFVVGLMNPSLSPNEKIALQIDDIERLEDCIGQLVAGYPDRRITIIPIHERTDNRHE